MKKILNSLFISAFALTALYSCQKEIALTDEQPVSKEPAIMTVQAQSIVTKTFVEKVSDSEYNLKWSAGDAIACYEVGVVEEAATVQGKVTSSALAADAATASFTMDFSGNPGAPNYSYIFVYPAAKYTKSGEIYRAQIPDKQTFSATTFDKDADVLISRAITDQTSRPTTVDAEFERIGATALMNIKAPTTTEKIRSITFSTTETSAYLAGYVKVYPLAGTHDTEIYSGGTDGRSITLTPASSTTYTGTIPVWFRLGEIALSNNFTVVVTTNKKIYTKTVDLATAGRTLEFNNAGLTKFNVNMTTVDGVDNPSLDDGDYYIVAKSGDYYYAMSNETKSNGLDYVQLSDFNPAAETYISSDETLVWTISNDGDAITIESETGSYLTAASKKASIATTKKTYTIATGSDSGTLSLNSVDLDGYGLRLNVGNYFAFYNSATSALMIGDFYFMPKDPRPRVAAPTNVEASASGTTITVIWDDASDANIDHYLVTLSGAADDSQTVAIGEGCYEFTGLSEGAYSVSVVAVASNSATHLNSEEVTISSLVIGAALSGLTAEWSLTTGNTNSLASNSGNTDATITVTNSNDNKIEGFSAGMASQKMQKNNYWLLTIPNVKNVTADTEVTVTFSGVKINKASNGTITYQLQYSWDGSNWTNSGETYTETATATKKTYTFTPGAKTSATLYVRYLASSGGSTSKGSHYIGAVSLSAE